MHKQLIKDFGLLINDTRFGLCDVTRIDDGINIGFVVFEFGDGNKKIVTRNLQVTYDNLFGAVRALYAVHPTRVLSDLMYSCKFDTGKDTLTLAATYSSNLELINVQHRRISAALRNELEYELDYGHINYVTQYTDKFISNFDRSGGFAFTLT